MQPSRYPRDPSVEHVRLGRIHKFTMIQLGFFCLLYTVKSIKTIAIAFPIVIALCIPFRVYILPKLFTEEELIMLDSDDTAIQNWLAAKEKLGEPDDDGGHNNDVYDAPVLEPKTSDAEPRDVTDLIDLATPLPDNEDERRDSLTPLPVLLGDGTGSYASSSATPPRRRARRVKSVSCPTHGSLFGESSSLFPPPVEEVRIKAHAQDYVETTEVETTEAVTDMPEYSVPIDEEAPGGAATTTLRRRRRHKTVSCPPHMLFLEAERHMNANYFFG